MSVLATLFCVAIHGLCRGALRQSQWEPISSVPRSRCALRTPPGPTFPSFSDSIRSTQHAEETCSTVLLPAANPSRSRVKTARELAASALLNRPRFAGSLSFGTACCIAGQVSRAFRSATRLCGCYGYRAGPDAFLRRCVLTRCSHSRTHLGHLLGNTFCAFLSPAAPTVRLPYRVQLIRYPDCRCPHPQARSLSRRVSDFA